MRDWTLYTSQKVLNSIENGKRLILEFADDYFHIFGKEICISCRKSFDLTFNKFLNKVYMPNKDFILKAKYNGLQLKMGSNITISNYRMSEELALTFIKKHPKGKELFSHLPKNVDELLGEVKEKKEPKEKKSKKEFIVSSDGE